MPASRASDVATRLMPSCMWCAPICGDEELETDGILRTVDTQGPFRDAVTRKISGDERIPLNLNLDSLAENQDDSLNGADIVGADHTDQPEASERQAKKKVVLITEPSLEQVEEEEKTDGIPSLVSELARVALFSGLDSDDLQAIAQVCTHVDFVTGDVVVKQGDEGDALYLIRAGVAYVRVRDVVAQRFDDSEGHDPHHKDDVCTAESACTGSSASPLARSGSPLSDSRRGSSAPPPLARTGSALNDSRRGSKASCGSTGARPRPPGQGSRGDSAGGDPTEGIRARLAGLQGGGDVQITAGSPLPSPTSASKMMLESPGNVNGKIVAKIHEGDSFGANALLRGEPYQTSIIAGSSMALIKFTTKQFDELGLADKLMFQTRYAVASGVPGYISREPSPQTEEETALIIESLRKNENLNRIVKLSEIQLTQMAAVAWKETVRNNQVLIKAGELEANYFYIVQEGSFGITVPSQTRKSVTAEMMASKLAPPTPSFTVKAGDSFGEIALLYLTPRTATVQATEDSIVWVLGREEFKQIMMTSNEEKISKYAKYLDRVNVFEKLTPEDRIAVATSMQEIVFKKGDTILKQGTVGDTFYLLHNGAVAIYKDRQLVTKLRASDSKGTAEVFGERSLVDNEPRTATVKVISESANVISIDRGSVDLLLGSLSEIISGQKRRDKVSQEVTVEKMAAERWALERKQRKAVPKRDVRRVGFLGSGGFAGVDLVEHKTTGTWYALKQMSKGYIVKTNFTKHIMHEKNILMILDSPFIIKMYESYNYTQHLFFLLEAALGGDLYSTYNRRGLHGSEKHCKYYIANVVFALLHLHKKKIIHRDIKPENILFTMEGRIKITDFDHAKFTVGKTHTTCGTPEYFAPEVIQSSGHHVAVDWWCLGILAFELMAGETPFKEGSPMQTCSNVMKGIGAVVMPRSAAGPVKALITGLLQVNPSERLPMRPGGIQVIKDLPFYKNYDWKGTENLTLEPPIKPKKKTKKDFAGGAPKVCPPEIAYVADGSNWDKDFATST
eukprot:TRINITY_DN11146_c0_g1_i2.p1 TRINITY_DN11146_c0_g1~~TRINITY_DN11146_c0_g1_i2.p1  ORF type:complete len:1033 (-),score=216.59 TRINITY_DN11146_c0_g1_i2:51-3107(-)